MEDISALTDEQLLRIITSNENSNVPGSECQRATTEYAIRNLRKKKLYQERIVKITESGINKIITLLEYIANKPKKAVFYGIVIAIIIGVSVNIFTELIKLIPSLIQGKLVCELKQ